MYKEYVNMKCEINSEEFDRMIMKIEDLITEYKTSYSECDEEIDSNNELIHEMIVQTVKNRLN